MPIWLRNYTLKVILDNLQAESEYNQSQRDQAEGIQRLEPNAPNMVDIPDVVKNATYKTAVSKKQ